MGFKGSLVQIQSSRPYHYLVEGSAAVYLAGCQHGGESPLEREFFDKKTTSYNEGTLTLAPKGLGDLPLDGLTG